MPNTCTTVGLKDDRLLQLTDNLDRTALPHQFQLLDLAHSRPADNHGIALAETHNVVEHDFNALLRAKERIM